MYSLKLKKQLSLVVFLPFLFVTTYSTNNIDQSVLPLYFITSIMSENEVEYAYTIKKINSIKNLINSLINQIKKVSYVLVNKANFIGSIPAIVVGETAIVLNRGSPELCF